jgi:methyl-galactoside transport system substrate-binding protein
MKSLKSVILIIITFVMTFILIDNTKNNLCIRSSATTRNQVNIGVLVSNINDPYINLVIQGLENIQKNNGNKIKFTFIDSKSNQAIEDEALDNLLRSNIDLLLGNLIDTKVDALENFIDKIREKEIPAVLFNAEPPIITNKMKEYKKFIIVTTDPKEAGTLQGTLVVKEWNKNKSIIDKNKDDVLQYIMLEGSLNNIGALERTRTSISTIENYGIKTQELARKIAFWNQELAKNAVESLFLNYDGKIEMIIANNDAMAIGAIEALQKYGYNKEKSIKNIPVFGVDGIPAAQDLIKKGFMTGTVFEDPKDTAEALYKVGMNLVSNKPPLEGTEYKFDEKGTIIRIPYRGVIPQ